MFDDRRFEHISKRVWWGSHSWQLGERGPICDTLLEVDLPNVVCALFDIHDPERERIIKTCVELPMADVDSFFSFLARGSKTYSFETQGGLAADPGIPQMRRSHPWSLQAG